MSGLKTCPKNDRLHFAVSMSLQLVLGLELKTIEVLEQLVDYLKGEGLELELVNSPDLKLLSHLDLSLERLGTSPENLAHLTRFYNGNQLTSKQLGRTTTNRLVVSQYGTVKLMLSKEFTQHLKAISRTLALTLPGSRDLMGRNREGYLVLGRTITDQKLEIELPQELELHFTGLDLR